MYISSTPKIESGASMTARRRAVDEKGGNNLVAARRRSRHHLYIYGQVPTYVKNRLTEQMKSAIRQSMAQRWVMSYFDYAFNFKARAVFARFVADPREDITDVYWLTGVSLFVRECNLKNRSANKKRTCVHQEGRDYVSSYLLTPDLIS
jgi:hypothetical protein